MWERVKNNWLWQKLHLMNLLSRWWWWWCDGQITIWHKTDISTTLQLEDCNMGKVGIIVTGNVVQFVCFLCFVSYEWHRDLSITMEEHVKKTDNITNIDSVSPYFKTATLVEKEGESDRMVTGDRDSDRWNKPLLAVTSYTQTRPQESLTEILNATLSHPSTKVRRLDDQPASPHRR